MYASILMVFILSGCDGVPAVQEPATFTASSPTAASRAATIVPPDPEISKVQTLDNAQQAVIQIEAQGTFVSPEQGMMFNVAGRGSGFIIDESGIAVTNNHVVTGAALLKVFVNGEDRPRNAKVLGISECSDLAVIDIEGDGFSSLGWYEGDPKVGLDVFAAGYPLRDLEYTLTRGIISKAQTDGETSWASVDSVLAHDATINPGNSGGPLLTADGEVVGINYAGQSETNQYFAISRDEARTIIDQLLEGQDVTSIGINGEAFVSDDGSLSGIWVWSVKSGSPADAVGVKPGDIVTKLERLVLATDGTMTDYCDILRSRNSGDTLAIEVMRSDTQQVLEGQLNGRALEETFSFANIPVDDGSAASYEEYYTFSDDTNSLSVEIPSAWSDTSFGTWLDSDQEVEGGIALSAAPSLSGFLESWTTPGMFLGASRPLAQQIGAAELLDNNNFSDSCTYDGRQEYSDSLYTGLYDVWKDCGGTETVFLVVAFAPQDNSFLGLVEVQVVTDADLEALDHILDTFVVKEDF
ncbi:MAG: trypsin-like peptidase domain-containing protein [Chloroflexales bacterium]|nr:trypsin-like peptidase domain-containing protein [Chloroflexales bacterium]